MNQNNMTSLLSLLIAIAVTMILVNYELSSADSIMQGVTLGVFSIMYLILVILMTRSFLNEVYLIIFSYIVLASFFGIEVLIVLDSDPRSANAGVWCTMFFIYMTYTLLALHVEECTVSGLLLGFTQVKSNSSFEFGYVRIYTRSFGPMIRRLVLVCTEVALSFPPLNPLFPHHCAKSLPPIDNTQPNFSIDRIGQILQLSISFSGRLCGRSQLHGRFSPKAGEIYFPSTWS